MDKLGEAPQGKHPGGTGTSPRTGQSGEGARSALEHLIQQEKKRDAQAPRDFGAPEPPGTES